MKRTLICALLLALVAAASVGCKRSRRAAKESERTEQTATDGEKIRLLAADEKIIVGSGKVRIEKVEDIALNGLSSCDLTLRVSNTTSQAVSLDEGTLTIFYGSSKVGTVVLSEQVGIAEKSVGSIMVPLDLRLDNLLTGMKVANKIQSGELDNIAVSLDAVVSVGSRSQRVEAEKLPLAEVLSAAGVDVNKK